MARASIVVRSYARKFEEENYEVTEDCMTDTASKRDSKTRK